MIWAEEFDPRNDMLINYTPIRRDRHFAIDINPILRRGEFYIYIYLLGVLTRLAFRTSEGLIVHLSHWDVIMYINRYVIRGGVER